MLEQLANAGPALTRALSFLPTFPFPKETLTNWMRGDYANLSLIVDLTLSRIDASVLHRNPVGVQSDLAGVAVGPHHRPDAQPVQPSASRRTGGNPLVVPYRWDQGP